MHCSLGISIFFLQEEEEEEELQSCNLLRFQTRLAATPNLQMPCHVCLRSIKLQSTSLQPVFE